MNGDLDEVDDIYEAQYARDLEGRLIRIEKARREDLEKPVKMTIDGRAVEVPKAVPATDDQGIVILDEDGFAKPRLTTIHDAAELAYTAAATPDQPVATARNPIPVLCHQYHVHPIGVCRVCSVLTTKKDVAAAKLVPACQHPVVDGMDVHTVASKRPVKFPGQDAPVEAGRFVRDAVKIVVELLAAQHLHADQPADNRKYHNELLALAERLDIPVARAAGRLEPKTPFVRKPHNADLADTSSEVIALDRNQCILCDRCVRACSEVKPFQIIGHTGFGNGARITFDLNDRMADSGCVSCGECAVACPTGALTFTTTIYQERDPWRDHAENKPETVKAEELAKHPLFAGVPYAFLKWNEGAVGRLECEDNQALCSEGEYGSTAFVIEDGKLAIYGAKDEHLIGVRTRKDVIVGEMACMTHQPRTATVCAHGKATVLVLRRNMLHLLQRNRAARQILYPVYRQRALEFYFRQGRFFAGLDEAVSRRCLDFLHSAPEGVEYQQVDPDTVIFRQGQPADFFGVINLGTVAVSQRTQAGGELVIDYLGPGRHFGEIGLLSALLPSVAAAQPKEARGRRTATCKSLDHVELVRIDRAAFVELLKKEPAVLKHLEARCHELLARDRDARRQVDQRLGAFTAAGLHEGQNLLVIDLATCTRCQECVKACSQTHHGTTRLLLEGNRAGPYLVPSACRSCRDPVCLVGCPVDAIHRRPTPGRPGARSLAIVIEDHCIGCGLCAYNCPFGSIHMKDEKGHKRIATNCDLCESVDGNPQCVWHCPHDAAHRMDGAEFAARLGLKPIGAARAE
jgi:Fe-S-cluster-containing hydrogenase component 2/CRP-like cAMP-binding protein